MEDEETKPLRGFAALSPERLKEISAKGGRTAHARGVAHRYTREEAIEAGAKGGAIISQDRAHMAKIGKRGGKAERRRGLRLRPEAIEEPVVSEEIEDEAPQPRKAKRTLLQRLGIRR